MILSLRKRRVGRYGRNVRIVELSIMMEVRLSLSLVVFVTGRSELMPRPLHTIQSIMEAFLQVSYRIYNEVC
jgi:hypothetical protein